MKRVSRFIPGRLCFLLLLRLALSLWYMMGIPAWEKADEINHYLYARIVALESRLPNPADTPVLSPELEIYIQYEQPPVYYILIAPFIRIFDGGASQLPEANPLPVNNPFMYYYLHPEGESFTALSVVRAFNIGLGLLSIIVVWQIGKLLCAGQSRYAETAAFLLAVYPPAIEVAVWLNNDAILILLGAIFLWAFLRYAYQSKSRLWALFWAVTAAFTKLTGITAVVIFCLAMLKEIAADFSLRKILMFTLSSTALIAGMLAFNVWHCGDFVCRIYFDLERLNWFQEGGDIGLLMRAGLRLLSTSALPDIHPMFQPHPLLRLWILFSILLGFALYLKALLRGESLSRRLLPALYLLMATLLLAFARVWWLQADYLHFRYLSIAAPALILLAAAGFLQSNYLVGRFICLSWLYIAFILPPLYYFPVFQEDTIAMQDSERSVPIDDYSFESGVYLWAYELRSDGIVIYWSSYREAEKNWYALIRYYDENARLLGESGMIAGGAFHPMEDWQINEIVPQFFAIEAGAPISYFTVDLYGISTIAHLTASLDPNERNLRQSGSYIFVSPK